MANEINLTKNEDITQKLGRNLNILRNKKLALKCMIFAGFVVVLLLGILIALPK